MFFQGVWWDSVGLFETALHSWHHGQAFQAGRGRWLPLLPYSRFRNFWWTREWHLWISWMMINVEVSLWYFDCKFVAGCIPQGEDRPHVQWRARKSSLEIEWVYLYLSVSYITCTWGNVGGLINLLFILGIRNDSAHGVCLVMKSAFCLFWWGQSWS